MLIKAAESWSSVKCKVRKNVARSNVFANKIKMRTEFTYTKKLMCCQFFKDIFFFLDCQNWNISKEEKERRLKTTDVCKYVSVYFIFLFPRISWKQNNLVLSGKISTEWPYVQTFLTCIYAFTHSKKMLRPKETKK